MRNKASVEAQGRVMKLLKERVWKLQKVEGLGWVLGILAFTAFVIYMNPGQSPTNPTSVTQPAVPKLTESELKQFYQNCEKFIGTSIESGVLYKIDVSGGRPEVYVGRLFGEVPIDVKQQVALAIAGCYSDQHGRLAHYNLYDMRTGEKIGSFDGSDLNLY